MFTMQSIDISGSFLGNTRLQCTHKNHSIFRKVSGVNLDYCKKAGVSSSLFYFKLNHGVDGGKMRKRDYTSKLAKQWLLNQ
jgi:hypothetical protein